MACLSSCLSKRGYQTIRHPGKAAASTACSAAREGCSSRSASLAERRSMLVDACTQSNDGTIIDGTSLSVPDLSLASDEECLSGVQRP